MPGELMIYVLGDEDETVRTGLQRFCKPDEPFEYRFTPEFESLRDEAATTRGIAVVIITAGRKAKEIIKEIKLLRGGIEGLAAAIPIVLIAKSGGIPPWCPTRENIAAVRPEIGAIKNALRAIFPPPEPPAPHAGDKEFGEFYA